MKHWATYIIYLLSIHRIFAQDNDPFFMYGYNKEDYIFAECTWMLTLQHINENKKFVKKHNIQSLKISVLQVPFIGTDTIQYIDRGKTFYYFDNDGYLIRKKDSLGANQW